MEWYIFIIFTCFLVENAKAPNVKACKNEPRCVVTKSHGMKAADCYNRNFKSFPKCVPNDVEVLELSLNRIRKIQKSDLSQFKSLKILYLNENVLTKIDEDVFEGLDDLMTLDLSFNGINKVPNTIYNLPSLSNLYLSQNLNINIIEDVDSRPITSPITQLDISLTCEDEPKDFPDFGELIYLLSLNITGNNYLTLTTKHFAGMCNLEVLINNNVTVDYFEECDCWKINNWLVQRKVVFTPFRCQIDKDKCFDLVVSEEDIDVFNQCQKTYKEVLKRNFLIKVFTSIGILVGALVLSLLVLFYVKRRKLKHAVGIREKQDPLKADNTMLLNNQKVVPKII